MEWILIAWIGVGLTGAPLSERVATEDECKQAATAVAEVAGVKMDTGVFRWKCIAVKPLANS